VVKGADCKSAMRRFESARRLHSSALLPHYRPYRGGGVVWGVREAPAPWRIRKRGPQDRPGRVDLVQEALRLAREGSSKKAISRTLDVPRSTVCYWVERFAGVAQLAEAIHLKWTKWGFESLHQHQHRPYAYLLGMYLGDGHIARLQRAYALRIYLHRDQVDIIENVRRARVGAGERSRMTRRDLRTRDTSAMTASSSTVFCASVSRRRMA
jgi:Homeodomain-like domain